MSRSRTSTASAADSVTYSPSIEIEYSMPSKIDNISLVVENVILMLTQLACVPGGEEAVEIALREALNNAVVHGNHSDPQKRVSVKCRCISGEIFIAVKDEGQGFDFSKIPNPTTPITVYSAHGRGIYLMKAFMDDVWFEEDGSLVQMRKRAMPGDHRIPQTRQSSLHDRRGARS